MANPGRVVIQADPARNLLEIEFHGAINVQEIKLYEAEIDRALERLRPDFFLLSDLTALESMDVACIPTIERMMDKFRLHGIGRVVRIIPDIGKDIGLNIMSLFHFRRGLPIITCVTRAEAEQALK